MLRTLVLTDLRRAWPALLRGLIPVVAYAILLVLERKSAGVIFVFVAVPALGISAMVPAMLLFQDRQRGTIAFLCRLPVSGYTLAAARFLSVCVATLPAVALAVAVALCLPAAGAPPHHAWLVLGLAGMAWIVAWIVGWGAIALLARFDFATALVTPFLVVVAALTMLQHFFPTQISELVGTVVKPGPSAERAIIWAVALAIVLALTVAAVSLVATAIRFEHYQPDPTAK